MSTIAFCERYTSHDASLPTELQEMAPESFSVEPPPLPPRRSPESVWTALKRFFQAAPWTGAALILLCLTAVGVMADVDAIFLRILLTWTLALLAVVWCLAWILPRAKRWFDATFAPAQKPETTKLDQPTIPWWAVIVIAASVSAILRPRPTTPAPTPNRFVLEAQQRAAADNARREATERYWVATVAKLHTLRFDDQEFHDLKTAEYVERSLHALESGIRDATAASKDKVDPELLQTVERHLKIDQQTLALTRELMARWEETGRVSGEKSAAKNLAAYEQLLNATDEDLAKLPPEVKTTLANCAAQEQLYDGMLQEILVLQIRLQERYKPSRFALPPSAAH